MQPDVVPAAAVEARINRDHLLVGQWQTQGYFGSWVEELWATRLLVRYGPSLRDITYFETSPVDESLTQFTRHYDEFVVAAHQPFRITSSIGPVLLIDRTIDSPEPDPSSWVRWALHRVRAIGMRPWKGRKEMEEAEFWDLIALLGGSVDESSASRLAASLASLTFSRQIGFQEVFDRKLFELDSPGNTVCDSDDAESVDHEASLMYRCEILARGKVEHEAHVRKPTRGTRTDGRSTPELLSVIEEASGRPVPVKSYPITTGSNPAYWKDAAPVQPLWTPPTPERPSPGLFSQRVQFESLKFSSTYSGAIYGFTAYATGPDHVREFAGCVMAFEVEAARAEVVDFLHHKLLPSERLQDRMLIGTDRLGAPARGYPLVQLARPTTLTAADYLARLYPDSTSPSAS